MSKWNKETCFAEAKKYKTTMEFRKNNTYVYNLSITNDWFKDYTWLESKNRFKWTYENVMEESKKFNTIKDFRMNSYTAYRVALINKWISKFTWLKTYKIWTEEACYKEARKYKSLSEFFKNNNAAYQAARKNNWLKQYTWFQRPLINRIKWTKERCEELAKKCSTRGELHKISASAYNVALKNKWIDDYHWLKKVKNI